MKNQYTQGLAAGGGLRKSSAKSPAHPGKQTASSSERTAVLDNVALQQAGCATAVLDSFSRTDLNARFICVKPLPPLHLNTLAACKQIRVAGCHKLYQNPVRLSRMNSRLLPLAAPGCARL
jgi:hypothetical protein